MFRPTKTFIDISALQHNVEIVRQLAPHSKIMAMVKANAYGHGLTLIAKNLPAVDAFGVACLEEALILRESGITQKIILVEGFFKADELTLIIQNDLDIVIHSLHQLEILKQYSTDKKINVWLKINTGMNRLGFPPHQTAEIFQQLKTCPAVNEITVMTHFADSDQPEKGTLLNQVALFEKNTAQLICNKSLANSGAIFSTVTTHADWVRLGIALYGVSPFVDKTAEELQLKPVMTFASEIIAIQNIKKGDIVGYGGIWQSPYDTRIAVVAAGYGDGYPRDTPSGTSVLINGKEAPIVGRVSMDMLTVDLHDSPAANIGDEVTLWGRGLPLEMIAKQQGRFTYELLCQITQRVPRLAITIK